MVLFAQAVFEGFTQNKTVDTKQGAEVLFSVESRAGVDEMAEKVVAAGRVVFARPGEKDGWMYGCAFADLALIFLLLL